MRWTWDPAKAAQNLRKHGVSFDLASRVFGDPYALTLPDPHPHEERWRTIGMPSSNSSVLLFVVHTGGDELNPDPIGRIISARRAEPRERKAYEEGQF
ncbi:BrnT family toxin [Inquilinus sp. NPDC058860]|uniref:BrnT family toxin n=1 Tax=Inquilinus sp. NPDC058860 TaxID=3346652 RepID=UPI0036A1D046